MRGGAAEERVVPQVAVARVALRKAVVDETQPGLVDGLPNRMQVGVV